MGEGQNAASLLAVVNNVGKCEATLRVLFSRVDGHGGGQRTANARMLIDSLDIAYVTIAAVATLDKPSACHDRTRCAHGMTGDDYATHVNDAVAGCRHWRRLPSPLNGM